MKYIFIIIAGFMFYALIIGITDVDRQNKILKESIREIQYSKDSTISYYEDISNCIKEDFDIKNGKVHLIKKK